MHELEKRFPTLPDKLEVVIKVPAVGNIGRVYFNDRSVPKEVCFELIDSLNRNTQKNKKEGSSERSSNTGGKSTTESASGKPAGKTRKSK